MKFRSEFFSGTPAQTRKEIPTGIEATLEDFKDTPEIYNLLSKLPLEIQPRHIAHMESLGDEMAVEYLKNVIEKRESAITEIYINEPSIKDYFLAHKLEIGKALETDIFSSPENLIGAGSTARIKGYQIQELPLAIKYLVSPNAKTLTVSGEHDLISEVERIEQIEQVENLHGRSNPLIKVPHPYFYYRHGKTQCYGMEQIDGVNLWTEDNNHTTEEREEFRNIFQNLNRDALMSEIDDFLDTMHEICIHGDLKPKNMMVSRKGVFYFIDFGQSVLASGIDEKSGPAFENIKEEEKRQAKMIVTKFLNSLERVRQD
jgi:serine/threonine protein kinase